MSEVEPKSSVRFVVLVAMIVTAALFRVIPHPPNFAPVMAIALFGGAKFGRLRDAFLVVFAAMLLSDLVLGFGATSVAVYLSLGAVVLIGQGVGRESNSGRALGGTLAGSVLFFVVTNLAVWLLDGMYSLNAAGLVACYTAAIPFFHMSLAGDLLFAAALFGGYEVLTHRVAALRTA